MSLFYAVLESINISVLLPLFNAAFGGGQAQQNGIFKLLDQIISYLPFADPFLNVVALTFFTLTLKELIAFFRQYLIGLGVGKVVGEAKEAIFHKLIHSDFQFFLDHKQGNLNYRTLHAPGRLGNCLQFIPNLMIAILMIGAIGALLLSISLQVTLALFILAVFFNFLTRYLAKKVSFNTGKERVIVSSEANVTLNEFLDGIKQIKLSNAHNNWKRKFSKVVRRFSQLVIKDEIWMAVPESLIHLFPPIMLISFALFVKGSKGINPSTISSNIAIIGVYAFAFYRLVPYLTSIGRLRMQIMNTLSDVDLLYKTIHSNTVFIPQGHLEITSFRQALTFEDVSFQYQGTKSLILNKINFSTEKGKVTAVMGVSGSGKSTIVNLMLKLFEPTSGQIALDGIPIKDIQQDALTNLIALVSQETFIFNASIRENIVFGLNGIEQNKVIQSAKLAHAHEFIEKLPEGYDTVVGDKGYKLSGGQRQRIAIARAFLRNPQIIIFDEATSSLDAHSEQFVQNAIDSLAKDRTVFIISHRLSAVQNAHKILVLQNGKIIEEGTHQELLNNDGFYRDLYQKSAFGINRTLP